MNKNNLFLKKKKKVLRKGRIEAQQYVTFLANHENVFPYDFNIPGLVLFPLFEVTQERCLPRRRYCNKQTLLHLRVWKVFTSCHSMSDYREQTSLKSPWFTPPPPPPPPQKKFCTNHGESAVQVVCLLFIVLFATDYTNQIKSDYLNSHGEEAQEKPPGL